MVNKLRLENIIENMKKQNVNQMIVTSPSSIFYITGKWFHCGERMIALLIKTNGEMKLFLNELFPISGDIGVDVIYHKDTDNPIDSLIEYLDKDETLGIDKTWPSHFLINLMEKGGASKYVNGSPIIDRTRMIKDEKEKALMRNASKINDEAMGKIISYINSNVTEKEAAARISEIYLELGAEGDSFPAIVGYGANGADPHHECDNSLPKEGDTVILDMGCIKDDYCSDMTRTVFIGEPTEEGKKVYNTVLEANLAGIAAVKPGARFCDVDNAAREVIEKAGYGQYFTHRTGHSIGIEVHDFGDVSGTNTDVLKPGMIFSVEPGIYLSGNLGVRIEDLVMVTEDGCEVLNSYTKDIISI